MRLHDVHPAPEGLLQVEGEPAEVEHAAAWIEVGQEIGVAVGPRPAPRNRPEDAKVAGAMGGGNPRDVVSSRPKVRQGEGG